MKKRLLFLSVFLVVLFVSAYTMAFAAGDKTVICHHNLDDPTQPEWVTIEVSNSAVETHIVNHGDVVGACPVL